MNLKCDELGPKSSETWLEYFIRTKVIWQRDDSSKKSRSPHVQLSSGMHANGYMNPDLICNPAVIKRIAAELLVPKTRSIKASKVYNIDRVVAPQKGGSILAYELTRTITSMYDPDRPHCSFTLLRKEIRVGSNEPVFVQVGEKIKKGENVILCDDVLTTSGTVNKMRDLVEKAGAKVLFTVVIAIDSNFQRSRFPVNYLCVKSTRLYTKDECPYCKNGSVLISSPKENWQKLVGRK